MKPKKPVSEVPIEIAVLPRDVLVTEMRPIRTATGEYQRRIRRVTRCCESIFLMNPVFAERCGIKAAQARQRERKKRQALWRAKLAARIVCCNMRGGLSGEIDRWLAKRRRQYA